MRKLNRFIMTLALLIMAVGGAWAQSSPNVVEFKVPAEWEANYDNLTAADLPGFSASTLAEAQAWKGAPAEGTAFLIYAFDGDKVYYVPFSDGKAGEGSQDSFIKYLIFGYSQIMKICYTAAPAAIELTPDTDKKVWTLAKMPANNIELQVEYEPTKVTMAVNDKTMGTVEVSGESKVEWTAETWAGWTTRPKEYTVGDITMKSSESAYINEYTYEGVYLHSLNFYVSQEDNNSTVTFSTTGDPFSRIEFTMIDDYAEDKLINNRWSGNPTIMPNDNWTFSGKIAVWEGEATKSLILQSCTTKVSKITFFQGAIPDGVTVNGDGTFTVAKTATVTLTATPKEGYKFLYWDDDHSNTNPVREVTIEPGEADMTYTAVFAEITYNVTFVEGTDLKEWSATPNTNVKKETKVDIKYNGTKKVIGVKVAKNNDALSTALTIEAITAGSISVSSPKEGMQYSKNGGAKTAVTTDEIALNAGDKVQFYGTATSYNGTQFAGTAEVKVYGNIMSLVSADFADNKVLTADNAFANLFKNYTKLKDASALLLPATTLTNYCYGSMFMGCSNLTAAPKLPATTLATDCYWRLFKDCTSLKEVYVKAAYVSGPCTSMFFNCSAADATLHTTSDNKASWTGNVPENWTIDEGWTD